MTENGPPTDHGTAIHVLWERSKAAARRLDDCITSAHFEPVRWFVYGLAGLALAGVGGAIVKLVLK